MGERIVVRGCFGRGGSWVCGCFVCVYVGGGYGLGVESGGRVFTPAMYQIKTSLGADVTISEIFKGGILYIFVPAVYMINTGQSSLIIDGFFSSPYILIE